MDKWMILNCNFTITGGVNIKFVEKKNLNIYVIVEPNIVVFHWNQQHFFLQKGLTNLRWTLPHIKTSWFDFLMSEQWS